VAKDLTRDLAKDPTKDPTRDVADEVPGPPGSQMPQRRPKFHLARGWHRGARALKSQALRR